MKFIKEGLENGIIMPEVPFELVYGGSLKEFGVAYLREFSRYSVEARQEVVRLIVSSDRSDIFRSYLEEIYCAMYAWNGTTLSDIQDADIKLCRDLIQEMLFWKKCGASGIDDVLYKVAFDLLYRCKCNFSIFASKRFEKFPVTLREEVVRGLLANGQSCELVKFFGASFANFQSSDNRNFMQKQEQRESLLEEFARWQKWGLDLSLMNRELEQILSSFIAVGNATGFWACLKASKIVFDEAQANTLIHMVNQSKFKKQHTQKMFLDIINKNRK